MQIVTNLEDIPHLPAPVGLTLGSFDGVHLGHQLLLKRLRARVGAHGTVAVLIFSPHPSQVLKNRPPVKEITTIDARKKLLENAGVNLLLILPFTIAFAQESYDQFLKTIKEKLPFSYLVLGEGATFGRAKAGDEAHVKKLEKNLEFQTEYLQKIKVDGEEVSSGRIRLAIEQGDLALASKLLGWNYA